MHNIIAQVQEASPVIDWIERLGFPAAMIVVLIIAMFKIAKWASPRIDSVVDSHTELVSSLEESGPRLETSVKTLVDIHYSTHSAFSTVALARVASLIAQHLQDNADKTCPKLEEAIRISDDAVREAESRSDNHFSKGRAAA